jgi:hypothetical protein
MYKLDYTKHDVVLHLKKNKKLKSKLHLSYNIADRCIMIQQLIKCSI